MKAGFVTSECSGGRRPEPANTYPLSPRGRARVRVSSCRLPKDSPSTQSTLYPEACSPSPWTDRGAWQRGRGRPVRPGSAY